MQVAVDPENAELNAYNYKGTNSIPFAALLVIALS
jgi:hypothetical protein